MGYGMIWVELKALREEGEAITTEAIDELSLYTYEVEYKPLAPKEYLRGFTRQQYTSKVKQEIQSLQSKFPNTDEEDEIITNYFQYEHERLFGFYFEVSSEIEFSDYIKEIIELGTEYNNVLLTVASKHTRDETFKWQITARGGKILTETWGYPKSNKVLNYVNGETPEVILYNEWDEENGQLITKEVTMKEHERLEMKEAERKAKELEEAIKNSKRK